MTSTSSQSEPSSISDLIWALKNGELDAVREFMKSQKVSPNDQLEGRLPLHYSADFGQTDVVKFLLAEGANPNSLDKHGISPLLAAIWEGHVECVRVLIEGGADVKGRTPDGKTFEEAAEHPRIKQLLVEKSK